MMTNIVLAIFFGWLVMLSYMVITMKQHYLRLTTRTKQRTIDEILDILLKQNEDIQKYQEIMRQELSTLDSSFKQGFHKVGVQRFDAFGKTEGEHSFVIALLNDMNSGFVLNFIYVHDSIRTYVKAVKDGKGEKYELSSEETKAIAKAA